MAKRDHSSVGRGAGEAHDAAVDDIASCEDWLLDRLYESGVTPDEYIIVLAAGVAAVQAHREVATQQVKRAVEETTQALRPWLGVAQERHDGQH